jgi:hypothetical protein
MPLKPGVVNDIRRRGADSSKTRVPTGGKQSRPRTLAGGPKTKIVPKRRVRKRAACVTIRNFGGGVNRQRLVKGVLVLGTALGCLGGGPLL